MLAAAVRLTAVAAPASPMDLDRKEIWCTRYATWQIMARKKAVTMAQKETVRMAWMRVQGFI